MRDTQELLEAANRFLYGTHGFSSRRDQVRQYRQDMAEYKKRMKEHKKKEPKGKVRRLIHKMKTPTMPIHPDRYMG